jgi:transposase InsO family protein
MSLHFGNVFNKYKSFYNEPFLKFINTSKLSLKQEEQSLEGKYLVPVNPGQEKEIIVRNAPNVEHKKERHLYNRMSPDLVWTIDFTYVNHEVWVFFVMDLATKKILGFEIKKGDGHCPFTTEDVILRLNKVIEEYQIPMKIHSDKGGQFVSDEFKVWAATADIELTTNNAQHGNQAHESMNRAFKVILNKELKDKKIVKMGKKRLDIVKLCVEKYNDKPNVLFGASPNLLETVLSVFFSFSKGERRGKS